MIHKVSPIGLATRAEGLVEEVPRSVEDYPISVEAYPISVEGEGRAHEARLERFNRMRDFFLLGGKRLHHWSEKSLSEDLHAVVGVVRP